MIRVRICTNRCRCHSSCRRSRFSGSGTQTCGKVIFPHQPEYESRVLTVELLLLHSLGFAREQECPHYSRVSTAPSSSLSTGRRSTEALAMSTGRRRTPSPTNDESDQAALNSITRLELLSGGIRRKPPTILSDVMRISGGAPSSRSG